MQVCPPAGRLHQPRIHGALGAGRRVPTHRGLDAAGAVCCLFVEAQAVAVVGLLQAVCMDVRVRAQRCRCECASCRRVAAVPAFSVAFTCLSCDVCRERTRWCAWLRALLQQLGCLPHCRHMRGRLRTRAAPRWLKTFSTSVGGFTPAGVCVRAQAALVARCCGSCGSLKPQALLPAWRNVRTTAVPAAGRLCMPEMPDSNSSSQHFERFWFCRRPDPSRHQLPQLTSILAQNKL